MCLSESTLLSLSRHLGGPVVGLGYTRFLNLFASYFSRIERIESARWLHLFSETIPSTTWERIVFIGKDREGRLRERWQAISRQPLIFIEMYPGEHSGNSTSDIASLSSGGCHVEEFQLAQLSAYGIAAVKKEIPLKPTRRVILYPEPVIAKSRWAHEGFLELARLLTDDGVDVSVLEPLGLTLDWPDKVSFQELPDLKEFLAPGGIFVSNDCGVAHLAGALGLFAITIFGDFDPALWHPRGTGLTLRHNIEPVTAERLFSLITGALAGRRE